MKKLLKKLLAALIVAGLIIGGVSLGYSGQPAAYKINAGDARWHTKLNAGLDALWDFDTSIAVTVSDWVGIQSYQTATYIGASSFSVVGDLTSKYSVGQLLLLNQGVGGLVANTVVSSSYGGGITTVIVTTANVVVTLGQAQILNPTSSEVVVASDYGTNQAALVAADVVAAAAGKQLVIGRTYSITSTPASPLTSNLKVLPGATISIATGVTLTINGSLEAGLYQIFSCTGTGKVVLPAATAKVPEWWGAVGNGSTDDAVPLQAWATCGGNLYLPKKTYKITALIIVPQYATIDGQGTIHQTTATVEGLAVKDDVTVKNITLQAAGTATTDAAYYHHLGIASYSVYDNSSDGTSIEATYVGKRVTVDNVTFSGGWVRAVILTADCLVKNSTFTDCVSEAILFHGVRNRALFNTITDCGGWAIDFNGGDSEASYNVIRRTATDAFFAGDAGGICFAGLATWKPMTNLRAIGNTIDGHKYAYGIVVISKPTDGVWGDITISDNYINGNDTTNARTGIYMYVGAASTVTCKNFKVTNNIVKNTTQGFNGVYLEGGTIQGNVFQTIHPDGVASMGAMQLGAINKVVVQGNVIKDVNGASPTALHLYAPINNCRITHNIGEGGSVGIWNAAGMTGTGNDISGNDFSGCATAVFLEEALAAGNRLERNVGYVPGAALAPAVPATTVEARNIMGYPVMVTVVGGTVTVIKTGSATGALTATGLTVGQVVLPAGWYISITHSSAPTWIWEGIQ